LRAKPQFESVAMSDRFRMTFAGQGQYEVDGQNYTTDRDRPRGNFESVSDNYFATLGLKILEGRDFTIDDSDAKQPVAIVNASFARKYYSNESPIGRRIRIYNPGQPQPWRTIVGVVPDTLMQGPFDQQTDTGGFYMPLLGADPATQFCTIIVRPCPGQRADTLGSALSRAVAELDSNLPTYFAGNPRWQPNYRHLIRHFRSGRIRALGSWSLRRDELFRYSADAGIWHPDGAGRGCRSHLSHGHDARRLAVGHRARSWRRRRRAAPRGSRGRCFAEHSLQGQHARSVHLFRGCRNARSRRGGILFRSRTPRHPGRSNGRIAIRVMPLRSP